MASDALPFLLSGDPSVRWQTMRDLQGAPPAEWQAERAKVASEGWGAQLLGYRDEAGTWGGGIYTPKWTSTVFTLLQLRDLGVTADCAAAREGANLAIEKLLGAQVDDDFTAKLHRLDLCIIGMLVSLGACFGVHDERLEAMVSYLLEVTMLDGAWNCCRRRGTHHSSFHTTFNVLEGLQDYLESGPGKRHEAIFAARGGALEFMLQHCLFRSDKTGEIINPHFVRMIYPCRWHYDVLRALDFFQRIDATRDERLTEAIELLNSKRDDSGLWPPGERYGGKVFFHLEVVAKPSRWNTLRALRVLKWWDRKSS